MAFNTKTIPDDQVPKVEIEVLVNKLMNAFSKQDAETFASMFAEDGDCIIRNGQHLKGRGEIQKVHQGIFASIYREGTKSNYEIESVRVLRKDVAVVMIKAHMEFLRGDIRAEVNGRISLVVNKVDEEWTIILFQNTSEESSK